mgnify:CR=1 FL=1
MINRAKTKKRNRATQINFKKELEAASRGMIMIHDPKLLIKLIIRMIVHKLDIQHAGMVMYDPERSAYVLGISKGEPGYKIPQGFTRFSKSSPVVTLFTSEKYKELILNRQAILTDGVKGLLKNQKETRLKNYCMKWMSKCVFLT